MKAKKDDLNKIIQDLTVKLTNKPKNKTGQRGNPTSGNDNGQGNNDGKTVDGDFEEVNPDQK